MTLGSPQRDRTGHVTNAVLVMHGTGGSTAQFLGDNFAGVLFSPGGLLDAAKYYIIIPDAIGHGESSKPSDGPHARFRTTAITTWSRCSTRSSPMRCTSIICAS
jgi:homoserine O-acetyltransferase